MILKFIAARSSFPAEPASGNISLDCALFCYKALRKRLEHSRSGKKHSSTSGVSLYTSFCSSRFLRALQQERAQSRPLYYSNKFFFKIHLCNFVRFQYIQADNRIRVLQWCWCSLHFRDKRGFLYIRQRLLNQIKKNKKWAIKIMQKMPLMSNYGVKECKP